MSIAIAMVMCRDPAALSAAAIQSNLKAKWPDLPRATELSEDHKTISFQLGTAMVILGQMPAPVPWSDLEGPCATSILWKNAAEEVRGHNSHWIVTVNGDLEPVELARVLTQATASVLSTCPASIGVYWGSAALVIPKSIFIEFAEEVLPEGPPVHIWVDFRVGKDADGSTTGFTTGLAALGHMEFETLACPEKPADLRERLVALAGYVLENGPVINDGDTIGEDANERIRVHYAPSAFGQKGRVMRLEYGGTAGKKPWWKVW